MHLLNVWLKYSMSKLKQTILIYLHGFKPCSFLHINVFYNNQNNKIWDYVCFLKVCKIVTREKKVKRIEIDFMGSQWVRLQNKLTNDIPGPSFKSRDPFSWSTILHCKFLITLFEKIFLNWFYRFSGERSHHKKNDPSFIV